ncbi:MULTISPECIES: hypothetical protein [unclassified Saccharibacter]|uniref:hypothetical protein n=1 Tax=unclassified Saccharibacter TaxID=2648722 RepID=UPI0013269391|nr:MULTISPECIES: hypothetical protein [unclassified Saccharibacter]MXV36808.1 hypothetical protein [Saccharibacter sp. EH611]MXV58702.1 hypothetical protein [Saccharibacter sp. EH70]MXV66208.1 hypothetical protein [Saccharibacter sp. EH60]
MSISKILDKAGRTLLQLGYVNSPILLTGGVADRMGGTVPIMLYTQFVATINGLISGGIGGKLNLPDLDNTWCHWQDSGKGVLLENDVATYPFANQTVAANALISKPIGISMIMVCPPRGPGAMATKLATMQSLTALLNKHCTMGGEFVIITPGQIYTNMLLTKITDSSPSPTTQPGSQYTFDFTRPLTQKSEAAQKMSTLMKKASGGMPGIGGWGSVGTGNILDPVLSGIGAL